MKNLQKLRINKQNIIATYTIMTPKNISSNSPADKPSKKPYIIVGALFVYMAVMAIYNIDTITVYHDYFRYFGTLAAELVVLTILFFVLRHRERLKRERLQDLARAEQERKAQSE